MALEWHSVVCKGTESMDHAVNALSVRVRCMNRACGSTQERLHAHRGDLQGDDGGCNGKGLGTGVMRGERGSREAGYEYGTGLDTALALYTTDLQEDTVETAVEGVEGSG